MELVHRYLQAVRFWLPKAQQKDIVAELSEDIRSQIEEKEAGLGRELNERWKPFSSDGATQCWWPNDIGRTGN